VEVPEISLNMKLSLKLADTQDMFFVAPLSNDRKNYFTSQRILPIAVKGEYFFENQRFSCGAQEFDCLAYIDNGRGQFNYHTNWFLATFMAVMDDGSRLAVSLGDGSASDFDVEERFTEDFINYRG
jgi:hypothetical protein